MSRHQVSVDRQITVAQQLFDDLGIGEAARAIADQIDVFQHDFLRHSGRFVCLITVTAKATGMADLDQRAAIGLLAEVHVVQQVAHVVSGMGFTLQQVAQVQYVLDTSGTKIGNDIVCGLPGIALIPQGPLEEIGSPAAGQPSTVTGQDVRSFVLVSGFLRYVYRLSPLYSSCILRLNY